MNEKLLRKLLRETKEQDWFDFKTSLKLYQSDGTLVPQKRDELLKDILGLANGNSHVIRKTKYLIIGVDDKEFDATDLRVLHNVDYKLPSQSDIVKWLSDSCSPAIVGVECELVSFNGSNLFVITIPPTFDLHETTRELDASGHFHKYTVFMRKDEHTTPASVRDGITIQRLKQLHRQEIANLPSIWLGIIIGGIVGLLIGGAKIKSLQIDPPISSSVAQFVFTSLGILFGGFTGWFAQEMNKVRYDWRYLTWKRRIPIVMYFVFLGIFYYFAFRK
jgi:hypothetical protein